MALYGAFLPPFRLKIKNQCLAATRWRRIGSVIGRLTFPPRMRIGATFVMTTAAALFMKASWEISVCNYCCTAKLRRNSSS